MYSELSVRDHLLGKKKKKKKHILNDDGYSGIGERADVAGSDSSAYSF